MPVFRLLPVAPVGILLPFYLLTFTFSSSLPLTFYRGSFKLFQGLKDFNLIPGFKGHNSFFSVWLSSLEAAHPA